MSIDKLGAAAGTALGGPLGGAIGSVAGSLLGGLFSRGKNREAERIRQEIEDLYAQGVSIPELQDMVARYEDEGFAGSLRDQLDLQTAETLGPSAFEDIQVDPRLQDAQMDALNALQLRGETGLTPTEEAELNALRRGAAGTAQAQSASVLQDMDQRGALDSGMQLAAQLSAGQNAASRQSEEQDRQAAMAYQQALQAVQQAGMLGGDIRNQGFQEEATKAREMDAIDKFNLENRRRAQEGNITSRNQAAERDLNTLQRLEGARAGNRSKEEDSRIKALSEQNRMQMDRANALATVKGGRATATQNQANAQAEAGQNLASGLMNIGASLFSKDDKSKDKQTKVGQATYPGVYVKED